MYGMMCNHCSCHFLQDHACRQTMINLVSQTCLANTAVNMLRIQCARQCVKGQAYIRTETAALMCFQVVSS